MFYKKDLRNNKKGITLIALIVTIIVLLILAGVSISMLSGENGIINQAKRAKNETENAARQEEEELAKIEAEKNGTGIPIVQVKDEKPGELEKEDDNTFVINSIEDLVFFSYDVRNGNTYEGKTVKLVTNLDFKSDKSYVDPDRTDYGIYGYEGNLKQLLISGEGFIPIGSTYDTNVSTNYFSGTFNGNYNYICNLYQNYEDSDNTSIVGLFSTNNGTIEGITLGGIIGMAYRTVKIINCCNSGNIINNSNTEGYIGAGGIVGTSMYKIDIANSYNLGNVESTGNAGGIIGYSYWAEKSIENCYSIGKISGSVAGGIIGGLNLSNDLLTTKNCYYLNTNISKGIGGWNSNAEALEDIQGVTDTEIQSSEILETLNQYVTENKTKEGIDLKSWIKGENGYPTFE